MKVSFTAQTPGPLAEGAATPDTTSAGIPSRGPATPVIDVESELVKPAGEIPTAPVTNTAIAVVPPAPVAVPDQPIEFDDGDIRFDEVFLPRLNIVQKVGDLSLVYEPGQVVLNQSLVIHTPANPDKKVAGDPALNIIIIGFKRRQFAEKVSGNVSGLLLNSEAEVVANGGTLAYKEWQQSVEAAKSNPAAAKKYFQPLATALLLVERPANLPDEGNLQFPYESEGRHYALALWSMKGTAYTNAAKHFFTARKIGHLKSGYTARSWSFTTKIEKYGENFAAIPVVRPATESSPVFRDFIKDVIGCAGK